MPPDYDQGAIDAYAMGPCGVAAAMRSAHDDGIAHEKERRRRLSHSPVVASVLAMLYKRCSPHARPEGWRAASLRELEAELNASPDRYPPRGKRWHRTTISRALARLEAEGWPPLP